MGIVGAGISGLVCATRLRELGFDVRLFDKGRKAGGRMSTRRGTGPLRFDHGAQYFTARDRGFAEAVQGWVEAGVVAQWDAQIASLGTDEPAPEQQPVRFVGTPTMSAVCRHLAKGLDVSASVRIARVEHTARGWSFIDTEATHRGTFDVAIVAVPSGQAAPLLAGAPALRDTAASIDMDPCWAAMLAFDEALGLDFDAAFVRDSPLSWIANQRSKPGRVETEGWVLHANADWTREHWESDPDEVQRTLVAAFAKAIGCALPPTTSSSVHRWRYSIPPAPLEDSCLYEPALRIGACGDWCGGPRVEGAYLSGLALAARIPL